MQPLFNSMYRREREIPEIATAFFDIPPRLSQKLFQILGPRFCQSGIPDLLQNPKNPPLDGYGKCAHFIQKKRATISAWLSSP